VKGVKAREGVKAGQGGTDNLGSATEATNPQSSWLVKSKPKTY
jgi:hypothetical protein